MAFYASTVVAAALLLLALSLPAPSAAFECYVGDGAVMRRKMCPSFGTMGFSDVCFKKIGSYDRTKKERGEGEKDSRDNMQAVERSYAMHEAKRMRQTYTTTARDLELCIYGRSICAFIAPQKNGHMDIT